MYPRKDYVVMRNECWKDEYYTLLDTVDRLIELLKEKYESLPKASVAFGKTSSYFSARLQSNCAAPRTKTIKDICQLLNVNINYVVFGTDRGGYEGPVEITYKNFIDTYNNVYKGRKCSSISTILSNWDTRKYKQIPLKYLIKIAREQKVTIDWLIGG